jgi:hypothetical protein
VPNEQGQKSEAKKDARWVLRYTKRRRSDLEVSVDWRFKRGLEAVLNWIRGTERVEISSQYALQWYSALYEALTAIREGKTWSCERSDTHRFENGRIVSHEVYLDEIKDGVSQLLSRVGPHIMQCARTGCLKLFVPNRKQRYCSPRCSGRTRLERFRSHPSSDKPITVFCPVIQDRGENQHKKRCAD